MKLKIVLEPSEDGGYTVFVPALPGCISEGDTREEALANITEAITLYLEPAEDDWIQGEKGEILELAL
jgi:predicted RNase H-like HicB family nuclease